MNCRRQRRIDPGFVLFCLFSPACVTASWNMSRDVLLQAPAALVLEVIKGSGFPNEAQGGRGLRWRTAAILREWPCRVTFKADFLRSFWRRTWVDDKDATAFS